MAVNRRRYKDWFAWYPIITNDGKNKWLTTVQRRYSETANPWGDASGHSGYDGGWEYRAKRKQK